MSKLQLSIAVGNYDRIRPLIDGDVQIDGVDPVFMLQEPEEIFFRAFRHADYDVCELSLSSYSVKTAAGISPYIAVPVFPSRAFRHTSVYVRADRGINRPEDLKGKRIGVPEYQLTANVWVRLFLNEEYGVKPSDVTWVRGGYEDPTRVEKIALKLPPDVHLENAPEGRTISGMLEAGEIDALIGPRAPSCFERGHPQIKYLFEDPHASAAEWYRRTSIFPIMHTLGIRKELAERHPWLPGAMVKAFEKSKAVALSRLNDTSATKVTLPFVEDHLRAARGLMGSDFWSYGFAANEGTINRFLKQHFDEGLSVRLLEAKELFHPASLESFKL
ncbi:ABC transporter substrate-binding protein [Paraburkholderia phenoliruptrix]|uniref:ABC transporter substrate-binding protein n=1 Tax=Paraburkholderia phenoliruptrix TaxID=252970 RepID=UPI001C6DEC25|nr:ABC transporter substrate-binding protein [Paraburkholderia phenoliruptrix]MBW9105020.1 ABC transporter substrate-binding protein [Paraburkholderia phenoliruptrix]MBW9129666.1 ABC transporter substrate-binding protein [Paraburkholderia ginsengiterrae]